MKNWIKSTLASLLMASAAMANAGVDEAKTLLDAAYTTVKTIGVDAAAKEFNAGGKWKAGAMYVVVVDLDGNVVSHAANQKMIGKNMIDAKDADGKSFVREVRDSIKASGRAQTDIRWMNPETKKLQGATQLARRVDGTNVYVTSTYWH